MEKKVITLDDIRIPDSSMLEWQVLRDVVSDSDNLPVVYDILRPDYFTGERIALWNSIIGLYTGGKPVNVTVIGSLHPEAISFIYSRGLCDSRIGDARAHAVMLRDTAARRRMYLTGLQMITAAQGPLPEDEVYTQVSSAAAAVQQDEIHGETPLGDILNRIADQAQHRAEELASGVSVRVTTGMTGVDCVMYGGFGPGQLHILAARPSVGKTALMLAMARAAAGRGKKVTIFSLEMTEEELAERMLYSTDRVNPYDLAEGKPDWDDFEEAVRELDQPIAINDHARSLPEIIARMTLARNAGNLDIAYVDYLSLIRTNLDARTPKTYIIEHITSELKATAKRLDIPIVVLAQLNRDADTQSDAPQLYHLKDSGAIEQDADGVLMLQEVPVIGEDQPRLRVWVRKNRHGRRNYYVELRANKTRSAFEEIGIGES